MTDVAIVGVGMHPFGRHGDVSALEMGAVAARAALADAGMKWTDIQYAIGGSFEVDNPDAVVAFLGLTGIDFNNVYNGCATAGTALSLGVQAIRSGRYDRILVLGMDKHPTGAFTADPTGYACPAWYGEMGYFLTTKFFGEKINRYMHDFDISAETLARVAAKNYANGALNENAFRRQPLTVEQIMESRMLSYPLTQYMFCSPDEGAAAVVLSRVEDARTYSSGPVWIRSVEVRTRRYGAFEVHSPSVPVERVAAPTTDAAVAAFEAAGVGPGDVDIAQLQDTDAGAEIIHMAEVGLCKDGEQELLVAEGATSIGGRLPINTDGGLIANGEPIGASGLRQIHELTLQLQGRAGERQVPGTPRVGLAHLYGAPGTSGVTIVST
jgi:acetyl-CoA C-acetyltransferase